MGSEVHLDIYDDRLIVTSPGGMYNGMLIQNLDIADVSSERRNPILANVMAQLDYMEKRGSGLTRICNETKALEGYKDELKPVFKSAPTQFQTIIYATPDSQNVGDHDGDMSETKLTERQQKILNLIKESPTITGKQMSETLSVSQRTIERDLSALQKKGVLKHEGKDNDGLWIRKISGTDSDFWTFPFLLHLSLQTLESPCGKGFEGSVGCFRPYTHPTLTPHSKLWCDNCDK